MYLFCLFPNILLWLSFEQRGGAIRQELAKLKKVAAAA